MTRCELVELRSEDGLPTVQLDLTAPERATQAHPGGRQSLLNSGHVQVQQGEQQQQYVSPPDTLSS